jgi:Rrf2 family protein
MKISAKTEYACLAMLELAARYDSGEPVRIRDIADEHGIPSRFLVQILLQLKGAGLVASTRGASGGYQLTKSPAEIPLGVVMAVIDGQDEQFTSSAGRETPLGEVLIHTWQSAADTQREMLHALTFADLVEQAAASKEGMYYI